MLRMRGVGRLMGGWDPGLPKDPSQGGAVGLAVIDTHGKQGPLQAVGGGLIHIGHLAAINLVQGLDWWHRIPV